MKIPDTVEVKETNLPKGVMASMVERMDALELRVNALIDYLKEKNV
jgi:hypothetical protein